MRFNALGFLSALLIALAALPGDAADAVRADRVVHITRVQPTHRLVRTSRIVLPYGTGADSLGFVPSGPERVAVGPAAFDVDEHGAFIVADPVRQKLFRLTPQGGSAKVTTVGPLPLPMSDIAVGRAGRVYIADARSRSLTIVSSTTTTRTPLPHPSARFVRYGDDVVIGSGAAASTVRAGALSPFSRAVEVKKCNAEAGRITVGPDAKSVQVEIGGPLASIRLIGVARSGDTFLIIERFRQRGRLDVDRQVVVIDPSGALKAMMTVGDEPAVHPTRDFVLDPHGALYRMVPGGQGVTFLRWEVQS